LDLTNVGRYGESLLPLLNELRESAPIVWNEPAQAWLVLRYEDVAAGFAGQMPLSNRSAEARAFATIPPEERARRIPKILKHAPLWLVGMDPPDHTRLRNLMMRGFSKKALARLRPYVEATVAEVLDGAALRTEVEFVEEIAREVTGRVIMHLIGADAIVASFTAARPASAATLERTEATMAEMEQVFLAEIARRRESPADDFLSELIRARDGQDKLTEDELVAQLYLLLIAGHESTTNTMALGLLACARHPETRAYFIDGGERLSAAVVELMRYIGMAAAMPRVASRDFEWHGRTVRKGDNVFLMIASANRDPRAFADPERLDLERPNDRSLVFGPGIHHCLGHLLAKMEIGCFFPELLRRYSTIEILDTELAFTPGLFFRGLDHLRVRLRP
jgi:cytochrome P450